MAKERAADWAHRLALQAESVCRYYLPNGRRAGRYWIVGDADNTPGRSLYVRLYGHDAGPKQRGKWRDAATGEHGNLLDLIQRRCHLGSLAETLEEARRFLGAPRLDPPVSRLLGAKRSPKLARRLFAQARPIKGTLAETYLRHRGITDLPGGAALRFHPRCFYRAHALAEPEYWPALLAAVTDLEHQITGIQRTWLARDGSGKAPVETSRRALGHLLGYGVRFGHVRGGLAAGEGIETVLSLRFALPQLPMIAALSASHLAALKLSTALKRLYIAQDNDKAGRHAGARLIERTQALGIEAIRLVPEAKDFNDDLRLMGPKALAAFLRSQRAPDDDALWLPVPRKRSW